MKKTLALILALLLTVSIFASCSSTDSTGSGTTPAGDSGTTAPAGDQGGSEQGGDSAGSTTPADGSSAPASSGDRTSVTIGFVGSHDSSDPCAESSNDFISQMM
ncbi:MAG: hypothetical protein ACI4XG_28155, partial [Bradyrhizobium sp.]